MKRFNPIFLIFFLILACTAPQKELSLLKSETIDSVLVEKDTIQTMQVVVNEVQEDSLLKETQVELPTFVLNASLPDSLQIDSTKIIYGDFNADAKEDFASLVTNTSNGLKGVLIVHNTDTVDYALFGAGNEINGMKSLGWIGIFETIPKGKNVAPTSVDPETGDILGNDFDNSAQLTGNGIYMHAEESCGGGILYWNNTHYEWLHVE
ncbi:hypothetical protein [Chondrinema litorale]|uniref:hypothetical protein n=1 Tax=Chondrinema litorale TaxID=2994555 RepID=UPI00254311F6|nr:hypothetical protein [Chondrinema litorale]UZR95233.1 hypothetical protein OQ292_05295 [Chondrinema litorale]